MTDKKYNGPMRFAHRGLVQYAPENTLGAFIAAVQYGCEGIEMDISLSKDGEVLVVHDDDYTKMTGGEYTEKIHNLTANENKAVELKYAGHLLPHNPPVPYTEDEGSCHTYIKEELIFAQSVDFRTTHLLSFKEFDKWFETVEENIVIEIEVKDPCTMKPLGKILEKSKNTDRYILFSGTMSINEEIQDYYRKNKKPKGLKLGANLKKLTDENIEFIKSADLYEVGLNDFCFDEKDIEFLNGLGIEVFSNLGDYPQWWDKIMSMNIKGFKTNYAEAYTEYAIKKTETENYND